MATRSPASEFRILSLSGGGYLGLYTAVVLADLEQRVGEPLGRRFDLIAGTSVGGLLAMALAFEVPMAQIVKLFVERGEEDFETGEVGDAEVMAYEAGSGDEAWDDPVEVTAGYGVLAVDGRVVVGDVDP